MCPDPPPATYGARGNAFFHLGELPLCDYANICLDQQAPLPYDWPPPLPTDSRTTALIKQHMNHSPERGTIIEAWQRPYELGWDMVLPRWVPVIEPEWPPWAPPSRIPPGVKVNPRPVPYRAIPERLPDPWQPEPARDALQPPQPERNITLETDGSTSIRIQSRPNTRRPPRRNEKEKKFEGSSRAAKQIFKWVARGKEAITEVDDFIDSIWNALPKARRKKSKGRKTPQKKIKDIYDGWDEIDWEEAAKNVSKNWIEDKIVGKALKKANEISDKLGYKSRLGVRDIAKGVGKSASDVAGKIVDAYWKT